MSHLSKSVSLAGSRAVSRAVSVTEPLSGKAREIRAIFEVLGMDFNLARINQPPNFQHTIFTHYTRWKNFNQATTILNAMKQAGTWTLPPLSKGKIIDLFASSSSFYNSIELPFSTISGNPDHANMKEWLDSQGQNPPALQVWGIHESSYTIADLKKWIEMGGTLDPDALKKKKKHAKSKDKSHKKGSTSKNT